MSSEVFVVLRNLFYDVDLRVLELLQFLVVALFEGLPAGAVALDVGLILREVGQEAAHRCVQGVDDQVQELDLCLRRVGLKAVAEIAELQSEFPFLVALR